jgi:membrane protease YdiL (CAAX protease family)
MFWRVVSFYILALAFTVLIGGLQQGTRFYQEILILPQLGPGLAALLMMLLFRKDGHRLTIVGRKTPASRYVLAALIPVGVAVAVFIINRLIFDNLSLEDVKATPWIWLLWMPFGAFGEELGWRGYLHKRLGARAAGFTSSLIVGVMWALWHVGLYQNGPIYMAFSVLLITSYAVVIYALVGDSEYNVVVATAFHLMINVTNLLYINIINEVSFVMVHSIVWGATAFLVVLARRPLFFSGVNPTQEG